MKILITGGFGYLGENIAEFLKEKGHDIRIFGIRYNEKKKDKYKKYKIYIGDILSKTDLEKACKNVDCIIHLAALSHPETCKKDPLLALKINGFGTKNVLEVGEINRIKKFIYVSSSQVYGNIEGEITERTLTEPLNDYEITKFLGELYCKQFNKKIDYTILRLSNIYGPPILNDEWNPVVNDLCKQCYINKKIILKSKGEQKANFVNISDLDQAINIILNEKSERIKGEIFNVGGYETISILELSNMIINIYRKNYKKDIKIVIPKDAEYKKLFDFNYNFNKIKSFGYIPRVSLKEGITNIFRELEGD